MLELKADQIKAAPGLNATVEASHITGFGCVNSGDTQRMLILMDIFALMASADIGLMEAAFH